MFALRFRARVWILFPAFIDCQPCIKLYTVAADQLRPLTGRFLKGACAVFKPIVELRHQIIDIALLFAPSGGVRIQLLPVFFNIPCGADPDQHLRADGFDRRIQAADKGIHIFAPPCRAGILAAAFHISVILRLIDFLIRGGIKIVVHMNAVHLIVLNDLPHTVDNHALHLRGGRIIVNPIVQNENPLIIGLVCILFPFPGRIVFGQKGKIRIVGNAVRIKPCVDRKLMRMRPFHQNRKRVVPGILPLCSRQIRAPGKNLRRIKSIRIGAHLYDDGIETCLLNARKHLVHFFGKALLIAALLRFHGDFIISNPDRTHLFLRLRGLIGYRLLKDRSFGRFPIPLCMHFAGGQEAAKH